MSSKFYSEALLYRDYAVEQRRWMHMHPEKSHCEIETTAHIRTELDKLNVPYKAVGKNITIGEIRGNGEGPIIALRADIDALEISEKNDVSYKSVNPGLMHACGHDAHAAALLTAARVLLSHRNEFSGTVRLIFQPAEEHGEGALQVVQTGLLNDVEAFFGIHVRAMMPVGKIALKSGPVMGGANSLKIKLTGSSGHGGRPHQAIDTIAAGVEIVQGLQQIVSRELDPVDPAVISVCQFHAGTRDNIIAGEASISGTVRVLHERTRKYIEEAVPRIVRNIASAHRVSAETECEFATSILENSPVLQPYVERAAAAVLSSEAIIESTPELGTEDFSVYGKLAPASFAFVGAGGTSPHHSDTFNIDEESIVISAALHTSFVFEYLAKE